MHTFAVAFSAEQLKLRRTLAKYLSLLAPIVAVALSLFILLTVKDLAAAKAVPTWQAYIGTALRIWAAFMLPILVTLQAVLVAQVEHTNHKWKHLLTLPVPRPYFYIAKLGSLVWLALLATALVFVLVLATAMASGLTSESDTFSHALAYTAIQSIYSLIAALLLIGLQLFISLALQSFTAATAIGLIATVICFVSAPQIGTVGDVIPWSMPSRVIDSSATGTIGILAFSLAGTLVVTFLGALHLKRYQEK